MKISRAAEALSPIRAEQKTEFGYGYACGMQAGLELAIEALDQYLKDESEER